MTKNAGEHGRRIPIRRVKGVWNPLTAHQWNSLQKIAGAKLSEEVRSRINYYCEHFALNAPLYVPSNTVLRTKLQSVLAKWSQATNQLLILLKSDIPPKADFEDFTRAATSFSLEAVNSNFPLEALTPLLQLCATTASFAQEQANVLQFTTITDLWDVWVTLIERVLLEQGVKVSARSSADRGRNSAFVEAIKYLQNLLPPACHTKLKDEAFVKAIQFARKTHATLSTEALSYHLVILSSQQWIPTSIGSIREKSDVELRNLDAQYQDEITSIVALVAHFYKNPELFRRLTGYELTQLVDE